MHKVTFCAVSCGMAFWVLPEETKPSNSVVGVCDCFESSAVGWEFR